MNLIYFCPQLLLDFGNVETATKTRTVTLRDKLVINSLNVIARNRGTFVRLKQTGEADAQSLKKALLENDVFTTKWFSNLHLVEDLFLKTLEIVLNGLVDLDQFCTTTTLSFEGDLLGLTRTLQALDTILLKKSENIFVTYEDQVQYMSDQLQQ